jgi:rapamycin-insensitive companion of mTOR
VSRTLYRSGPVAATTLVKSTASSSTDNLARFEDQPKTGGLTFDEATFRQMLLDTQVLSSTNYLKWNWEIILKIIEGPLLSGKRLDEAIKASKFIKRIISFYRPFKYKFAEARNTRPNQKYVKVGCALIHTLLQTAEGVRYLADNKLLRQIAECLAQCDPVSNNIFSEAVFRRLIHHRRAD